MNPNDFTPDISAPTVGATGSEDNDIQPVLPEHMPMIPMPASRENDMAAPEPDYPRGSWHSPVPYQNTERSPKETSQSAPSPGSSRTDTARFLRDNGDAPNTSIGSVITVLPRPVTPCFYCNSNSFGMIRFLNTAVDYNPFMISINNRTVVDSLNYAEVSEYGRIASGYQTVTVSGRNGYIYISKQLRIIAGSKTTVAIIKTSGGLDLMEISDPPCYTLLNGSCMRAANLSYNSGPLTLSTHSGNVIFANVTFMDVTDYARVIPGHYDLYIASQNQVLLLSEINPRAGSQYTIYMFNWSDTPNSVRTLIIEDRI